MGLTDTGITDLLRRIGARDEAAMRDIYREFSRKIHAYVLNHVRDPALAEDITVETLYEVWRRPDGFRGESKFSTWLIGIARYKMLSALRARDPAHEDLADFEEVLPSDDPDAFDQLVDKQRREGVQHCMGKLSEAHRECLHLVFYEGMSLAEVAQIQACPEGTIKSRLHHAKESIRKCLQLLLRSESC